MHFFEIPLRQKYKIKLSTQSKKRQRNPMSSRDTDVIIPLTKLRNIMIPTKWKITLKECLKLT